MTGAWQDQQAVSVLYPAKNIPTQVPCKGPPFCQISSPTTGSVCTAALKIMRRELGEGSEPWEINSGHSHSHHIPLKQRVVLSSFQYPINQNLSLHSRQRNQAGLGHSGASLKGYCFWLFLVTNLQLFFCRLVTLTESKRNKGWV